MPFAEFRGWLAFYADEPFGDTRADLRSGIVAALIARTMGGKKNAKPIDFMPIVASQRRADEARVTKTAQSAIIRNAFEAGLGPIKMRRVKIRKG
jgi:hypothetical protein